MSFENVKKISYKNETFSIGEDNVNDVLALLGIDTSTVNLEVTGDTLFVVAKAGTKGITNVEDSSVIKSYSLTEKGLVVQFRSDAIYLYPTVTEDTFNLLERAESKGHFFANHIRDLEYIKIK